ncbi:MAG: hypothetical protein SPE87_04605 [Treponema porcinum]|uniref:hypothetical protein n=1 Tax=Treponema porcinum TaxID=261392 RepID=UPI002A7F1486|nr:hypothetical protein [Treponema porcinum]MDY5047009.1 hypothetical protein [Treponema porcinum]
MEIYNMQKTMTVNGTEFNVVSLLGKGKGGYSYLAERGGKKFVLKQIHHEPCSYYTFGNKIEAEQKDYATLKATGIKLPELIDTDVVQERILKEFIDGPTAMDLVKQDKMTDAYIGQIKEMCRLLYPAGLNIDYFPTNFVVQNDVLFYIDYECNNYMEEWNFENWGIKYWSKTKEFLDYVNGSSAQ